LIKDAPWAENVAMKLLIGLTTYVAVLVAWVYFRASSFESASRLLGGMFGRHATGDAILSTRELLQVGIVTFFLLLAHWTLRDISIETAVMRLPRWVVTAAWFLMACAIILTQGSSNAFIYFQF
nr:MBOAT family protein [Verrucomicrobiota bacterium]